MSEPLTLDEQTIERWVGSQSSERGRSYWTGRAIRSPRREGAHLRARCEGSSEDEYRVEASLGAGWIADAHCTCPVGGSGRCKHVAALLLAWLENPAAFREMEPLEVALDRRSKEELIALIRQMLRMEPDLESLLDVPLPSSPAAALVADPAVFRSQAEAAFSQDDEWGAAAEIADRLRAVIALGDDFKSGDQSTAAIAVYRAVLEVLLKQYLDYQDDEGELGLVISELANKLGGGLTYLDPDDPTRRPVLRLLLDAYQLDLRVGGRELAGEALDIIFEETSPEERTVIAGWIRDAITATRDDWTRKGLGALLLDLEEETLGDEEYLAVCRSTGRIADLVERLLTLGRIDEAAAVTSTETDYSFLALVPLFEQQGQAELVEEMIRRRSATWTDMRLLEWLKARYLARGDLQAGLDLALTAFRKWPSLPGYQGLRELAEQAERWETLRPELQAFLGEGHRALLIKVHLDEADVESALRLLKVPVDSRSPYGFWRGRVRLEVARAAAPDHPREALALYKEEAAALIHARNRTSYAAASAHLRTVRDLYLRLGEEPQWTRFIAGLREQHRALRALREELLRAGL